MKSPTGTLIDLAIVWAIASAFGFVGMAGLMLLADWTLVQGLFAAAILFFVLGTLLSVLFLKPLPGPKAAGTAGVAGRQTVANTAPASDRREHGQGAERSAPTPVSAPTSTPAPAPMASAPSAAAPATAPGSASDDEPEVAEQAPIDAGIGARPLTLDAPRDGGADNLKRIKGIGPKLEKVCHSMGFYHFDQIANWTPAEVAWVDENLEGFRGRVVRDDWVAQARLLASGDATAFSRKVDGGDIY